MIEIERKFLVDIKKWIPQTKGLKLKQGYLSVDPERTVRVRRAGEKAYLTIKGKSVGISRTEIEVQIQVSEAEILLDMCLEYVIEKIRYKEEHHGVIWEIDVFKGINEGLVLAEVELEHEAQNISFPDWIKIEVSGDERYFNSWLSQHPFTTW